MKTQLWFLLLALPAWAQVEFTQQPEQIAVAINGKPYTTYFLAPGGNKPYVYPLRTADGLIVTRHFPIETVAGETNDHPHHRGMFFAHGEINGVNFWATEPGGNSQRKGSMVLKKIVDAKGGPKSGTIRAVFDGLDPQGKPIMTETRTLVFHADPKLRLIDFEIQIEPLEALKFGDTKEGTFGIRLATSMQEDRGGKMVNAQGAETQKNVWGKRSEWVDYCGPVEGRMVGVAVLDHPSNPRHPTYWHARAYGLLAANIFGVHDFENDKTKDGSFAVAPRQSLRFRYRSVIHPGDTKAADIATLYKAYAGTR
jgi:hypothetical protein